MSGKKATGKKAAARRVHAMRAHAPKKKAESHRKVEVKYEFPFTRARVEKIMRDEMPDKELSPRLKLAMNNWLGEIASSVAKTIARSPHRTIKLNDFENAIKKYDYVDNLKKEKEKIAEKMDDLAKSVEKFGEYVEKSIILREEAPKTLIYGHLPEEYDVDQEVEQALYVAEGGTPPAEGEDAEEQGASGAAAAEKGKKE